MAKNNPFAPVTDPVCKMKFPPSKAAAKYEYNQTVYYFCNIKCKEKFAAAPEKYLQSTEPVVCCCCAAALEDDEKKADKYQRKLLTGFIVSAVIMIIIMVLNHIPGIDLTVRNYSQALLATLTVFGPGGFLLLRGIKSLRGFKLNMFTLISMGIASAYFYSLYALFFAFTLHQSLLNDDGYAKLHFAPAVMITALVLLGQYLENRASAGTARAVRSLMAMVPPVARKISCCGNIKDVPLDQVVPGDRLKVLPGDKIPVDGIVIEGNSPVDESMLTGEAIPTEKFSGCTLSAGTVNGSGVLIMEARQVGSNTLIARIAELVKTARKTRLPIQKLADKVSAVFVPLVLLAALTAFFYWGVVAGNWPLAMSSFISVLLVACPCSLGLAAPLAVTVGVGSGARYGILIKDPAMLETLRKADTLMLDKTGTLTENKLQVREVLCFNENKRHDFMQSVFALEQNSTHPLAQAIINMPERSNYAVLPQVTAFESVPGQGVKGIVDSELYIAGNYDFLQKNSVNMQKFQHIKEYSGNLVLVACGNAPAGFLVIDDVLRSNAASAIAELKKMHVDPVIVSGGNRNSVKHTACLLGIDEFYAELSPEDKLAKVKARQAFGRCVAMVGDGVNDTAALAAADVNIAMGSGTDAALENAGITLLAGNIGKLVALWNLSHAVRRNIKQNLLLAFAYNIIMIPMAAGVFYNCTHWQFNPVWGSIAMSGSCLLVVGNALRLRLFNPEKTAEF